MKEHDKLKEVYKKRKLFKLGQPIFKIISKYKKDNMYNIMLYMHVGEDSNIKYIVNWIKTLYNSAII